MITQLESLDRDIDATWLAMCRAKDEHDQMALSASTPRKQLLDLVLDLFSRVRENASGVRLCLGVNKILPAMTCYRAALEAGVTLRYLVSHDRPEFEAQVAKVHYFVYTATLEERSRNPDTELIEQAAAIVEGLSMPPEVLEMAQRRKRQFSWTGRKFEQLCATVFGGDDLYHEHYKGLSSFAHPHAPAVTLVDPQPPAALERCARLTRIRLRDAFTDVRRAWGIPLPDTWLDDPATAP